MNTILTSIFRPHDGTRQKVREDVATSRRNVEKAANRFDETIRDLMERNDKLRGRCDDTQIPPDK